LVGCFVFEIGSFSVAQAGLKFSILLPQPHKYWDYRYVPPRLACLRVTFKPTPITFVLYSPINVWLKDKKNKRTKTANSSQATWRKSSALTGWSQVQA
jgi:hypothetical protein